MNTITKLRLVFRHYFELMFWILSIVFLALMSPGTAPHLSLCIFKFFGITFCPGCGLGHSISHFFHGNIQASFSSHPLGIFAVIIILFRIYKLLQNRILSKKIKKNYAIR
jgi:hypothetical protein